MMEEYVKDGVQEIKIMLAIYAANQRKWIEKDSVPLDVKRVGPQGEGFVVLNLQVVQSVCLKMVNVKSMEK